MTAVFGMILVLACVIGGYWHGGGRFDVLAQPTEFMVIGGAAVGSFLVASTRTTLRLVFTNLKDVFSGHQYGKAEYLAVLSLLSRLLIKVRREGLASVESDIEHPQASGIFGAHRVLRDDPLVVRFICDTFRVYLVTGEPGEIEGIMHADIESMHAHFSWPAQNLSKVAESLPGLGIVAAVLGVVLTMQNISAPPDVLGRSIGGALVGTFLGVLLCYGFVGPMGTLLEHQAAAKQARLKVVKSALMGYSIGLAPILAVEYARRAIPTNVQPSMEELEEGMKKG